MKVGDKLYCIETVENLIGYPLFIEGNIYKILDILNDGEEDYITLNHILYANEYSEYSMKFVKKYFITIKQLRKMKLDKLKSSDSYFS